MKSWHQHHLAQLNKLVQIAVESNIEYSEKLQLSTEIMQQLSLDFHSISIKNAQGIKIVSSDNTQDTTQAKYYNKLLIEKAKTTLKPLISNASYNYNLPAYYVHLVVPIVIKEQFVGLIDSTVDRRYFSELLKIATGEKSWQIAVVDSQNYIIASTELEKISTSFDRRSKKEFRYINSTMYNWLPSKQNLPLINSWQQSLYGHKISVDDMPWNIVVEIPAKSYINYLNYLYVNNFGIVLLVGILAIESAILVSRKISSPLAKLAYLTNNLPRKLINGEDIEWFDSSVIKIDFLINNFRLMAIALNNKFSEIKSTNESLEEQVQERTNVVIQVKQRLANAINQYH